MTLITKLTRIGMALAATLLLTFGSLQAQRIAVVDVDEVLNSLSDYEQAQKELDQLAATWRQDIAKEYDNIKSMYNRYQTEQVLLSDDARRQREEEIMAAETRVRELQKSKFGPEGALFEKRRDLVQPIQDRVYRAIEDYANERGFDFILDKGAAAGLLFSAEKHEKTADILARLK